LSILLAILLTTISYLWLSPSWDLTFTALIVFFIVFLFCSFVIGFPLLLYIKNRKPGKTAISAFGINLLCMQLSLLIPLLIIRLFQVYMADVKKLSQWGQGAMFHAGELTEKGLIWMSLDFIALFFSILFSCLLVFLYKKYMRKST